MGKRWEVRARSELGPGLSLQSSHTQNLCEVIHGMLLDSPQPPAVKHP